MGPRSLVEGLPDIDGYVSILLQYNGANGTKFHPAALSRYEARFCGHCDYN
jgi:hypothetical protein